MGAQFFHADGLTGRQTDMKKFIVAFCNFANTPKNAKGVVRPSPQLLSTATIKMGIPNLLK
jgi:hypothetical protein